MDGTLYAGGWDGLYRFDEQNQYPVRVAIQGDGFYPNRMTAWKNVIFAIDPQGTLTSFSLAEEGTTIPQPSFIDLMAPRMDDPTYSYDFTVQIEPTIRLIMFTDHLPTEQNNVGGVG